ncbi:MAG: dockerin type I repeat-containing protein [Prevotella sp.]|nr:dockerin type I repeat-containing protein [Prevotella sp.]
MKTTSPLKTLVLMAGMLLTSTLGNAQTANQDTTVVVPETGYLAIKPSRNFTGPKNVLVCSMFGSNSSGLSFTKFRLDTVVVASTTNSSSGLLLVAKPGTYTLTLTDDEVTGKIFSTSVSWQAEPGQAYKRGRILYKFVNKPGQVGFERDEKYVGDNYQYCDMAEGEHIYLPLAEKNVEKIAELLETTKAELAFIPIDGPWKNVPTFDELPADEGMKGDVNGDGTVDVADISAIISQMAGTAAYEAADVNEDGSVDVADISFVITIMAGGN